MIIVQENRTPVVTMYLRDPEDSYISFELDIISEDQRVTISSDPIEGWTFDGFRNTLTFSINTEALSAESFYIVKVWEEGRVKLLSQDKMYIIPTGSDVGTYQPKLATTEKTMDNEFKVYGE